MEQRKRLFNVYSHAFIFIFMTLLNKDACMHCNYRNMVNGNCNMHNVQDHVCQFLRFYCVTMEASPKEACPTWNYYCNKLSN